MQFPKNSVGLVTPQLFEYLQPFDLDSGKQLPGFQLVYETYGRLNYDKNNALLVCHALSGSHHVAGYHSSEDPKPGWWENLIGPGKPIDTDRFFVVCVNSLGGCHGSTGPLCVKPQSTDTWAADFPLVTVSDWVRSQRLLRNHLGIARWCAVVGPSLGGMQALQWTIDYPDEVDLAVVIAAAPRLSAQNIAFNEIARSAITSDPHYHDGYYQLHNTKPRHGLMLARMLGHVTYLSDALMHQKFGREKKQQSSQYSYNQEFMVESYLHYQADKFADFFDANTYLLMTRALDYFDPAAAYGNDLRECLSRTKSRFLVISFSSDWRFSPAQSEELVTALLQSGKSVSYACIDSNKGHDAFLLEDTHYFAMVANFLTFQSCRLWNIKKI